MPEQAQMTAMQNDLIQIAQMIQADLNTIESKHHDEAAIDDEMDLIKHTELQTVLTDRHEINNQLKYTNDKQRDAALKIALDANQTYQDLKSARAVKIVEQSLLKSKTEFSRKEFRAKELLMLYYANNPSA